MVRSIIITIDGRPDDVLSYNTKKDRRTQENE